MEFNIFDRFKGIGLIPKDPTNPWEVGTSFFTTGHMGPQINDKLDGAAQKVHMDRRSFVKTASGFAAALLAVNQITGMRFFDVQEAEAKDLDAGIELAAYRKAGKEFICDQHTHICWRKDGYVLGKNTTQQGMWFVDLLDGLGKAMGFKNGIRDMTVENFGKVILDESDTSMAIFNPFGFREDYGGKDMVPIEEQAEVKQRWPDKTIMMGGGLTPNQGISETLERLNMFVKTHKIAGLKLYTFDSTKKKGWWMDDTKLAYPIWEEARKLGIKNIGVHKGIPFGQFMARYAHADDLDLVCDDFLDMNFIVFHSAWPYHGEIAAMKGFKPQRKNMFCELGSTFAATVTNRPLECAHVVGTLVRDLGEDSVLWGTDSTLWANPQWQIESMRRFKIPDQLVEGHGYPQLTDEVKAKIFGLNAAKLWGIDVKTAQASPAKRNPVVAV
jgi:hypothetical protein